MRAAYYERTGPADEVLVIGELPDPQPRAGEVRVRMQWSGVNPSDVKTRSGSRGATLPFPRVVPHSDGMGSIDAIGEGVDSARLGQRVWTWNAAWERADGTAAQFVVLPAQQAVALPDGVPGEAGACMGIPAMTALHAVLTEGGVSGQRVLIAGGAGAVGHYAIQFARLLGASQILTTVSSESKGKLATAVGATTIINYRTHDVAQAVLEATSGSGVDRVIEVDIAANAALDLEIIRPEGHWIVYGSGAREFSLPFFPLIAKNLLMRFFMVYRLHDDDRRRAIALLHDWLLRGVLKHNIAERFPLDQIAAAHKTVEQGKAVGNVVLAIA